MHDTTMRYLQHNAGELNKQYEQISSLQKINRPSDNPIGFTNALNYGNILSALGQHKINMEDGEIYMNMLETAHESIKNVFGRCRDLAVQSANDTENHQNRLFTNMEIRDLLVEMVTIAQTKHKDNYMFSGKWTNQPPYEIKSGTGDYRMGSPNVPVTSSPPFNPGDPSPFEGTPDIIIDLFDGAYTDPNIKPYPSKASAQRIIPGSVEISGLNEKAHCPEGEEPDYEIDYMTGTLTLLSNRAKESFYDDTGNRKTNSFDPTTGSPIYDIPPMKFDYIYRNSIDMSGEIYREVSSGVTMKINTNPDDMFVKDKLGQTDSDSFKEIISLMQGLWYNDQAQINKGINEIDRGLDRNLEQQAIEGARQNRLSATYERNDYMTMDNTAAKSALQDVDLTVAVGDFTLADAIYNASLQMAARIMQRTMMDYL